MNSVLKVNPEDQDVRVQAGVTRKQLNHELSSHGLFFPVDPGADATLGGMVATGASGTNAVRYGTIRENLLGLTVVMPNGEIIQTGGRARKSASGYDLTHLFCGSEGTLGVITEVQLKLHGRPEAHSAGVCAFETLEGAVDSVITIIQMGIPVARIEFLDAVQMKAVNQYSNLNYAQSPTLFFEFHGTAASVVEQSERVGEIVAQYGAADFIWSTKQEEQNKLWQARHDAYYASIALRPGCSGWPTDVCVPISRLTECIQLTKADIDQAGVLAPMVGHVGDGNFHLLLLVDTDNDEEMKTAMEINDRLIRRAIEMGGTATGEHGVGYGKLPYMALEHGASLEVMRQIKTSFDPDNIMNPGKVIPNR
jgi:D-lactate dehydrogenase (cytochrome)